MAWKPGLPILSHADLMAASAILEAFAPKPVKRSRTQIVSARKRKAQRKSWKALREAQGDAWNAGPLPEETRRGIRGNYGGTDPELCNARTKSGRPCRAMALEHGRCKWHGGLSTGPRTPEGKAKAALNLVKARAVLAARLATFRSTTRRGD